MFHVNLQGGWSNFEPNLRLEREMIQFDEHIFQLGWFNHRLVIRVIEF